MPYLNEIRLMGHVGREPEVTHTKGGNAVAKFSLATTRYWKQGEELKQQTTWHNIVNWSPKESTSALAKGDLVLILGRVETRDYEKDGKKVYVTEVIADKVEFLRPKNQEGPPRRDDRPLASKPVDTADWGGATSDDVPFGPVSKRQSWM